MGNNHPKKKCRTKTRKNAPICRSETNECIQDDGLFLEQVKSFDSHRLMAKVVGAGAMNEKVTVDRKQLLHILVQVENALEEIQELKKEIRK